MTARTRNTAAPDARPAPAAASISRPAASLERSGTTPLDAARTAPPLRRSALAMLASCGALAALMAAPPAGAVVAATASGAQWPARPIKWLVPYLPGTAPDSAVRVLAEALTDLLGQPVVVENKAGAAGNIGAQLVASARPDGYTWIYSGSPMAGNMRVYKAPGFDVMKDFRHVSQIATSDLLIVVPVDSAITSVKDLVEQARRKPATLNYGSGGIGTPAHLGAEMFLSVAGVSAVHVPYKGASDVVNALISGQIDFAFPVASVAYPLVKAGKLRPLAVTGPQRNEVLPQVPTLREAGVPVTLVSFGGVSLPAGTPEAIVRRVNEAVHQALARPAVRDKLQAGGQQVAASTPEQFTDSLKREIAQTEKMMAIARLQPQ